MLMPDQHLYKSLWSLQITFTLTEGALFIILQSSVEKLLAWLGIELTTLDLCSQASTYDL